MSFWKKISSSIFLSLLIVFGTPAAAIALQSSSADYGVDEVQFDSGSSIDSCSSSYCSNQTAGDTAVGNAASSSYQIEAGGDVTDRADSLELIVNGGTTDIGTLTDATTSTTSATFSVKSYLTSGYVVYTDSPGPQNNSYTMKFPTTPTSSAVGTEQFGMNLTNNTTGCGSPANVGANPTQIPDSTFSYGQVEANYDTCGKFLYKNGDAIAYSNSSSGETDYTISYIFNISGITPGGTYSLQQSLVAASTF
jgi:hypothetical protein